MRRTVVVLCGLWAGLVFPTMAQASDASLVHALAPYKNALTGDLIFMAELVDPPTKSTASSTATRLSHIQADMAGAGRAARGQKPSTAAGRKAQSEVLTGLADAYGGAGDALAAVAAVRAGRTSAANADIAHERTEVGKSLPYFQESSQLLGLFED